MSSHSNARAANGSSHRLVLDRAIIAALGDGQKVTSAERYGNSAWSASARITTEDADGNLHYYFTKIVNGLFAGPRTLGEYHSMKELYQTLPSLVPTPRAAGECLDTEGFFFLCDYKEMDHRLPNPVKLGERVAELHRTSLSPTGKFGFHITPYDGKLPLVADWDSSWPSFYGKLLAGVYNLDLQTNGPWPPLDKAMRLILDVVIPRLLGALESNGQVVKPCLIHGNLWEENIGTDPRSGEIYIFDAAAYYAHHEMGIGMWRVDHHNMKAKEYRNEYFKNFAPDEPIEEYDDRNRLYCVKEKIMYSAHVPGSKARAQALEDLEYLIHKYSNNESAVTTV